MSEIPASYLAPAAAPVPSSPPSLIAADRPLTPSQRALIIGLRRVCLLLADVLGEFAGLPKRE